MTNPILQILKMKTTSDKKKDDLKACRIWILSSKGEIWGKLRGNPECGSAQPSLFYFLFYKLIFEVFN